MIAIANRDGLIHLRSLNGDLDSAVCQVAAPLKCVAISPDGTLLATGNARHTIEIRSLPSILAGQAADVSTLIGHADAVTSANFSADSQRLVSTSPDHCVKLWSVDSGQEVLSFLDDNVRGYGIALFDSTSQSIIVASNSVLDVWSCDDGRHGTDFKARTARQVADWHTRELQESRQQQNAFAQRFHLNGLLEAEPANPDYLRQRAIANAQLSEFDPAIADFEAFAAIKPDDVEQQYHLGLLYLTRGESEKHAAICQTMMKQADTATGQGLNTIAWTSACCLQSRMWIGQT